MKFKAVVWTEEEWESSEVEERMLWKLELVEKAAVRLAENMLKGTLKYEKDSWTEEEWIEHAEDEALDLVNYIGLLKRVRE